MSKRKKSTAPAGTNWSGRFAALVELYEQLPRMQCQGLCSDSCYSLVQTDLERAYVRDVTGIELQLVQTPPSACPALGMMNTCTAYEARPMICRLWGMTAGMRCQYGCVPKGGYLSAQQFYEFLAQVAELAGDVGAAAQFREPFEKDPELAEKMMMRFQRLRDLEYEDQVSAAGDTALFMVAPGRFVKQRPRSGRW